MPLALSRVRVKTTPVLVGVLAFRKEQLGEQELRLRLGEIPVPSRGTI